MDLSKSYEFFKPEMCKNRIHLIGCGSVGSTVAELLTRFGLTDITLYDFDSVESKNLANQMFWTRDLNVPKVVAVKNMMCDINPDCREKVKVVPDGWHGQKLAGYIFLCADSVDVWKAIVNQNMLNPNIKAMFNFRTGLTDAQHYAADWSVPRQREAFVNSMDFTHEEAREQTPVSACGVTLSVAPTVRMICTAGVTNFINFVKGEEIKKQILCDAFNFTLYAM